MLNSFFPKADSVATVERLHRSFPSRIHLKAGALRNGSEEEISCTSAMESSIVRENVIECLTAESSVVVLTLNETVF